MKTYVWTVPTRIFHWLMVISLVLAYLVAGEELWLRFHAALGLMAGCLVLFRMCWGWAGPLYSRFGDFPVSPGSFRRFLAGLKDDNIRFMGHNPPASVIMTGILICILCVVVSGMLLVFSGGSGMSALNTGADTEVFEELHEISVNLLIVLVIIHMAGLTVEVLTRGSNRTLASMFTGYKNGKGKNATLSKFQRIFSVFWIVTALAVFTLIYSNKTVNIQNPKKTERQNVEEEEEEADEVKEEH